MKLRALVMLLVILSAGAAFAQRDLQVDPLAPGDLVYIGPDSGGGCFWVTFFTSSDPCHVAMFMGNDTVTQATAFVEPHAVYSASLTLFEDHGYRGSMTTAPHSASDAQRDTMTAYVSAKAARMSYYDGDFDTPKGGYDGGCAYGISSCWDGWDYYNEFDCVGLTERAYELAATPDSEGPTPDFDPFNGCTWEGYLFFLPQDQYNSCKTTYVQAFPPVGATVSDTVKHGFWRFYSINVPSGVVSIAATTTSATDIDLYVGTPGYLPNLSSYTCASTSSSGNEQCQVNYPAAGGWGVGVYGYANTTSSFTILITQTGAPSALTGLATNITSSAAQLRGTVTANGLSTTTAFDYGTTTSYGQSVPGQAASGSAPQAVSANVAGLACNTLYRFRVRASNSGGTALGGGSTFRTGNCPIVFTNDPLLAGVTPVRAIHITELRAGINALRTSAGLTSFSFAETIVSGGFVKASHIGELRTALDQTRAALGLTKITYAYAIVSGAVIHAIDIMEIRNALR